MPIDIMIADTTRSMIMNGMKIMNPMRKAVSISREHEGRDHRREGQDVRVVGVLVAAEAKRLSSPVLGLFEHPLLERHLAGVDGLGGGHLAVFVGLHGHVVDRAEHGRHDEDRDDQRQTGQHLVGRHRLRSQGVAGEREHDEDTA